MVVAAPKVYLLKVFMTSISNKHAGRGKKRTFIVHAVIASSFLNNKITESK